jgi:YesN/AraC family two-component response regulator
MGNFQRADSVYTAWQSVQYEGDHTRDYFIADYLRERGRYPEAVKVNDDLIQKIRAHGDTLGEMMNCAKWGLAEVYQKMGNYKQAADLYVQVLEINDTLKARQAQNTAQELAAVYHDKEQQQTIMQQEAENTRQKAIILIVVIVLIAVMALAVIVLRKNRIIHRKNQSLAQQINEAMVYKEKYLQQMAESTRSAGEPTDPDKLTDEQLFQYINDVIVRERLFLASNFERQTIIDRFQLSKERVGAAFSKGSQYAKLTDYTQELRLEYSTFLMSSRPDMSISQIALDSGFSSYAYYGKCFRRRFGMTPTEFRQSAGQR